MQDDTRGGGHMLIFKDILGHEQINAAAIGKVSHAYILAVKQEWERKPLPMLLP